VDALLAAFGAPQFDEAQAGRKGGQNATSSTNFTNAITAAHPAFLALARESRIVDRVAQLIGDDLQLHHSKVGEGGAVVLESHRLTSIRIPGTNQSGVGRFNDSTALICSKACVKPDVPGEGRVTCHQDFAVFPHTNEDNLAVMVLLDDSTASNGCLRCPAYKPASPCWPSFPQQFLPPVGGIVTPLAAPG
jgi:hypothetical protein